MYSKEALEILKGYSEVRDSDLPQAVGALNVLINGNQSPESLTMAIAGFEVARMLQNSISTPANGRQDAYRKHKTNGQGNSRKRKLN